MVNFAELKAKAEKAKDVGITKVTNTRDRLKSAPSSSVKWDPNWKRAPPATVSARAPTSTTGGSLPPPPPPPPPLRSRPPDVVVSGTGVGTAPPAAPRASRPTDDVLPPFIPPPPPTRAPSGYPPSYRQVSQDVDKIDWANLSPDDKEEFFGWLDEFFSRYLGIELSPRERRSVPVSVSATSPVSPPMVNMATRPQV